MTQLMLWDTPAAEPREAWTPIACPSCGITEANEYAHQINHGGIEAWGECMTRKLARSHVHSYARAISTRGVWPGRERPKQWKRADAESDLFDACERARRASITDAEIQGIVLAELACGGRLTDRVIYRAVAA